MSDIAIRVENLSKLYHIGAKQDRPDTLRDWLTGRIRRSKHDARDEALWALKDISFEVKRGEVVGVIGRNGAGKSTLLKILSRITEPAGGRVEMDGRVGSLLEVGTGFHPELTGRENVYLSGAILGMRRIEIDHRFDEIVDFSGVEKFIDTPIKRYSSGMQVRLGFAVAAHLEPEILLIDEVLAVGDAQFQRKCLGKLGRISKEGRTVLFVSHNLAAIEELCSRTMVIHSGTIIHIGSSNNVVEKYVRDLSSQTNNSFHLTGGILKSVECRNLQDEQSNIFRTGDGIRILLELDTKDLVLGTPRIGIGFNNHFGQRIFTVGTYFSQDELPPIKGKATIVCEIENLVLVPGDYFMKIAIGTSSVEDIEANENAANITISPGNYFYTGRLPNSHQGVIAVQSQWFKR